MKSPADMRVIQIEITNACPKRCSNCTRFCGHHTEPFFMDFETFKTAVQSMKGFKGVVGIMGGEPTIHPEFEKFVKYFKENFGEDDPSTACYKPTSSFVNHILADVYNVVCCNQRGLWTSVTPRYYQHFELIQDTFGYQLVNDHSQTSMHETLMVTRKELGIPDDEWVKLRDKCWIQNLWSASITPKGAFFCEIAGALDATFNGPGGWKIEPGWWNRKPADFGEQLKWCEMCSAALPMPKRNANEEVDDVSPVWHEKLVQIDSPKLKKGLVNEFDPKAYKPEEHDVINERTPYMKDQTQRLVKGQQVLLPQSVLSDAWLTGRLDESGATRIISDLKGIERLDFVVSEEEAHCKLAEAAGVQAVRTAGRGGREVLAEIRERSKCRDWVLLMRDSLPPGGFFHLLKACVFNPGCLYWRYTGNDSVGLQFFNVRAFSLKQGADLFDLAAAYPSQKVISLEHDNVSAYRVTLARNIYRRALKRIKWPLKWMARKIGLLPPPSGGAPMPEGGAPTPTATVATAV